MLKEISLTGFLSVLGVVSFVAFMSGWIYAIMTYRVDTYECTTKCPNMAHSLQHNDICYCEIK
jgi:hypothetical protein